MEGKRRRNTGRLLLKGLAVAVPAAAALVYLQGRGAPLEVRVISAREGDIREVVSVTGRVDYADTAETLRSETGGEVVYVYVKDGGTVNPGQEILKIDDEQMKLQVADLEIAYNGALNEYNRLSGEMEDRTREIDRQAEIAGAELEKLLGDYEDVKYFYEKGIASKESLDTAYLALKTCKIRLEGLVEARNSIGKTLGGDNLKVAEKRVEQAGKRLDAARKQRRDCLVAAGKAGKINFLFDVSSGSLLKPLVPFARIADPEDLVLTAGVDETDIGNVRVGMKVAFKDVPSMPEQEAGGVVSGISSSTRPLEGFNLVEVTIKFKNHPAGLRAGGSLVADIIVSESKNTVRIPEWAVLRNSTIPYVLKYINGRAEKRPVKTGICNGIDVEILDGLGKDDRVIMPGDARLKGRGERVMISRDSGNS